MLTRAEKTTCEMLNVNLESYCSLSHSIQMRMMNAVLVHFVLSNCISVAIIQERNQDKFSDRAVIIELRQSRSKG